MLKTIVMGGGKFALVLSAAAPGRRHKARFWHAAQAGYGNQLASALAGQAANIGPGGRTARPAGMIAHPAVMRCEQRERA